MRIRPTTVLGGLAVMALVVFSGVAGGQGMTAPPTLDGLDRPVPPAFRTVTADRVVSALALDRLAGLMSEEIVASGDPLQPVEPGASDPEWAVIAGRIAAAPRIRTGLRQGVARGLSGLDPGARAAMAEALGFLESDLGRRVVGMELAARAALADPEIEAEARAGFARAAGRGDPRVDQIRRLIAASDTVEPAVAASLGIAMASMMAMQETLGLAPTAEAVAEDVWLLEPELRAEQAGWIEALFFLSTATLTPPEMERLIAEAARPGSRRLGAMVDAAAADVFVRVARDLGRAAALRRMGTRL